MLIMFLVHPSLPVARHIFRSSVARFRLSILDKCMCCIKKQMVSTVTAAQSLLLSPTMGIMISGTLMHSKIDACGGTMEIISKELKDKDDHPPSEMPNLTLLISPVFVPSDPHTVQEIPFANARLVQTFCS